MYALKEGDFEEFFAVPFNAYGADSPYVSPLKADLARFLDTDRHPTFDAGDLTYFSVTKSGVPIGRIVAHVHRASNALHGTNQCYFGFFDCADDETASAMLLEAAEAFARRHGCDELIGNFNLTAMQMIGVVTGGFEHAPYTDQTYNPPHIPALLEAAGYRATFPVSTVALETRFGSADPVMKEKQLVLLKKGNLRIVSLSRWRLKKQLEDCRALLNAAFAENPMFVPLTSEEFMFQAKDMMLVVDTRITAMAYDGDRAVGAVLAVPDLNPFLRSIGSQWSFTALFKFLSFRRRARRAVIIYYAVHPDYANQGVNGLLIYRLFGGLVRGGYTHCGGTWIADSNAASLRQVEKMGAKPLHRLHLFAKRLA